ncbi:EpsD family peptidyl-prolyl cis-trans isomerase [Collimonas silvisoli]|uniref:EpsD family peptidyl-prolyl cis-trans isomerase n=1 Tax=Collimonas silvisoli TaxID=2825884 RepID=UPI001B8C932B|nr:EpsD family peptidyl-prolyl cis-trans isomerase [Collimonas silvisoli]
MSCSERFDYMPPVMGGLFSGVLRGKGMAALMLLAAISLTACGDQKKKTGKILARVNGDEITAQQLDAELQHASGAAEEKGTQRPARKQVLEALIDRQVLLEEALRKKLDRDPKLLQVIERFKTQAIVQAYLEAKGESLAKPSKAEIDAYFQDHPELFAHRKVLDIEQLAIAAQDFSEPLKAEMDTAKSLNQMAAWLEQHNVAYVKTQLTYSSADLSAEIIGKIKKLGRNHLFVMQDGQQALLCALTELRESPVTGDIASAQIERYLLNKKMQEVAAAEIARLRSLAKLEYVDKSAGLAAEESPAPAGLPGKQSAAAENRNRGREMAEVKAEVK